jgi:3-deoxy-7-phosphoheptulonate synthase
MTFGIIGFGRFGEFWADCLKDFGQVLVYDVKDVSKKIRSRRIRPTGLQEVAAADMLFLLMPISRMENCCKTVSSLLSKKTLVIDGCSVKVGPLAIMKKYLPEKQPFISSHPLFGPNSVNKTGLTRQKYVICDSRCPKGRKMQFEKLLRKMKLTVIHTTAQKHDRMMAGSQTLIHFLGRALSPLHLESSPISTPNYEALLEISKIVKENSWQLFLDMQKYNPYAEKARQKLISAVQHVQDVIMSSMSYRKIKKIPTPDEIVGFYPVSKADEKKILKDKQEVKDILSGKDSRLLVIVGPCSAWPAEAVIEYAKRLKKLNEKVKDRLKIILRLYIQKPRTAKGWTGPINQPDPFAPPDIEKGIKYCRSMMVKVIKMGLPIADEALFTHNAKGFMELLSWVAIGARSSEDQEHRIHASSLECAVGMKNPTSGSIEIAVNGIVAAQNGHTAVFNGYQIETAGNPYAHLVLRGGMAGPNYHTEHLFEAKKQMEKQKILNPAVIIDASHDNCKIDGVKDPVRQVNVTGEVFNTLRNNPELKKLVKGFMFESYIKQGCQKAEASTADKIDRGGLSITDPCIGWEQTEQLINEIALKWGGLRDSNP